MLCCSFALTHQQAPAMQRPAAAQDCMAIIDSMLDPSFMLSCQHPRWPPCQVTSWSTLCFWPSSPTMRRRWRGPSYSSRHSTMTQGEPAMGS